MNLLEDDREQYAIGGIVRALSSKAKKILRRELPKRYDSLVSKKDAKFKVRSTTPDDIIKDYEKGEDIIFYTMDDGNDSAITETVIDSILLDFGVKTKKTKKFNPQIEDDTGYSGQDFMRDKIKEQENFEGLDDILTKDKRKPKAKGGDIPFATGGLLEDDREQYVIGGAISAIKKGITKLLAKVKESAGKRQDSKRVVELRTTLKEFDDYDSMLQKKMADDPVNTDYTEEFELLQEAKFYVESELTQFSKMNRAEGGEIQEEEELPMELENSEMLPDDEMEDEFLDYVLDTALTDQEEEMLMSKLEQDGEMSMLFDKVIDVAQEFAGSGPVEGPGSGVSDSIPARLSDGEFVFTAKAVEEIGADNLMAMMKDAEMKADDRQGLAEGGEPEEETVEMPVEKSATKQDIRVVKTTVDNGGKGIMDEDEISKSIKSKMMLDNRTGRHVQS